MRLYWIPQAVATQRRKTRRRKLQKRKRQKRKTKRKRNQKRNPKVVAAAVVAAAVVAAAAAVVKMRKKMEIKKRTKIMYVDLHPVILQVPFPVASECSQTL